MPEIPCHGHDHHSREIVRVIREVLDSLPLTASQGVTDRTKTIKTALCRIGRERFLCQAYASDVDDSYSDGGEWLYDVIWLEHDDHRVVSTPLVAECEFSARNLEGVGEDFDKMLLPRAGVRLMIYESARLRDCADSKWVAEQLATRVRKFRGSHAEDVWLLADWEECGPLSKESDEKDWRFRYYTLGTNATLL